MKNKKLRLFNSYSAPLFREKFLIYKETFTEQLYPENEEKEQKYREGWDLLNDLHSNFQDESGVEMPEVVLKRRQTPNPFKAELLEALSGSAFDKLHQGYAEISEVARDRDAATLTITVKDSADAKTEIVIEGKAYIGLYWPEIFAAVESKLAEKNVSPEIFAYAVHKTADKPDSDLQKWLLGATKGKVEFGASFDNAVTDINKQRAEFVDLHTAKREKLKESTTARKEEMERRKAVERRAEEEREALRADLPKEAPIEEHDDFMKQVDSEKQNLYGGQLDRWKINIERERTQVNVEKWNPASVEGVRKVYEDFQKLGIAVNEPVYQTLFAKLRRGVDPAINGQRLAKYPELYANPERANNMRELGTVDPEYRDAYQFYMYVKNNILTLQDEDHLKLAELQRMNDQDAIAEHVENFFAKNINALKSAARNRDWSTLGMYAFVGYSMWKAYKSLDADKQGKVSKAVFWAGALYGANKLAKNAGHDFMKMAGFKEKDAEVKGTPMEALYDMDLPSAKDLDPSVALTMSTANLGKLFGLFEIANNDPNGMRIIHASEFPDQFDPALYQRPPKMPGQKGLSDYAGDNMTRYNNAQKSYIEASKQLFILVIAMREAYNKTIGEKTGVAFEDAVKSPRYRDGKVWHMLSAIRNSSPELDTKLPSTELANDLQGLFGKVRDDVGVYLDTGVRGGHYPGTLMGFPVVYVATKTGYRVYLKNDYKDAHEPGQLYLGQEIPKDPKHPNREQIANTILNRVEERVDELLTPFYGEGYTKPEYRDGEWAGTVVVPGSEEFDIQSEPKKVRVEFRDDGKGVILLTYGANPGRINVDESLAEQMPGSPAIIEKIVKDYPALRVFANGQKMRIEDSSRGDKKVDVILGPGMEFEMEYVNGKFQMTPAAEKALVRNPRFAAEYLDALRADDHFEINLVIDRIAELTKNSQEGWQGFGLYVWQTLSGDSQRGPLGMGGDVLSGPVPDNFTKMVLESSREHGLMKLRGLMRHARSLKDVEDYRQASLTDLNNRLKSVEELIKKENHENNRQGKAWDRISFMNNVIRPLRASAAHSSRYEIFVADMERSFYSLDAPGLDDSDLANNKHRIVQELMNVYFYYTAHLDTHSYKIQVPYSEAPAEWQEKYPTPSGDDDPYITIDVTVDLDNLKTPPQILYPNARDLEGNPLPQYMDPNMRGWAILNYMKEVQTQLFNRAHELEARGGLDNIPGGPARDFWRIKDFDSPGYSYTYSPLDPLDGKPAFAHDPEEAKRLHEGEPMQLTELEREIIKEFKKAEAALVAEFGPDTINHMRLRAWLYKHKGDIRGFEGYNIDPKETGILGVYKDARTGQMRSTLWEWANEINSSAGESRAKQMQQIKQLIDKEFYGYVFAHPDDFFYDPPSIKERLLRRWPWAARYYPF